MREGPAGSNLYVTNFSSNTVSVIDVLPNTVIATVPNVGPGPSFIAITPDGARAYVTNVGDGDQTGSTVSVIDTTTNAVVATVNVESRPVDLAITPDSS